ncbi:MAG: rod shape-determining protein RodA [Porphyromonas sp.]|nr:rod shape-determining protein RodA [Porphyromonas sp.]
MASNRNSSLWQSLDWWSIGIYLLLVIAGWFTICGATYSFDMDELFASGSRPMMQALWIGLGLVIAFAVLMINSDIFETSAPILYAAMLCLCLITIFIAPDIKGSRSWLVIGPLRLQPAEFTKVATALTLAWLCNKFDFEIGSTRSYITLIAIILTPVVLIIGQSETGSALVFFALFLALYREGFTGLFMGLGGAAVSYFVSALVLAESSWWGVTRADWFLTCNLILLYSIVFYALYGRRVEATVIRLLGGIVGIQLVSVLVSLYLFPFDTSWVALGLLVLFILYLLYNAFKESLMSYLLIAGFALGSLGFFFSTSYVFNNILQPHQQVRIRLALGIEEDLRGKGYNVDQSKIAIGSGGLLGKGFLEGTQTKLNYVPEQDTDFIFCTVGEEQGFVGSSLLILLYSAFILRLCALAERQTSKFGRVYGYCVASIFFFHLFINVGMVLGLIPVIGIPLPFFSYGGSSLWGFSFMLFIFLGIDARRNNRNL